MRCRIVATPRTRVLQFAFPDMPSRHCLGLWCLCLAPSCRSGTIAALESLQWSMWARCLPIRRVWVVPPRLLPSPDRFFDRVGVVWIWGWWFVLLPPGLCIERGYFAFQIDEYRDVQSNVHGCRGQCLYVLWNQGGGSLQTGYCLPRPIPRS